MLVSKRERGKSQDDSRQLPSHQGKREAASRQLGHQLPWTQITLRDPGPVSASCSLLTAPRQQPVHPLPSPGADLTLRWLRAHCSLPQSALRQPGGEGKGGAAPEPCSEEGRGSREEASPADANRGAKEHKRGRGRRKRRSLAVSPKCVWGGDAIYLLYNPMSPSHFTDVDTEV